MQSHCAAKTGWMAGTFAALFTVAGAGLAQTTYDLGKNEFEASCASCHGVSAKGTGAMRPYLVTPPADLTTLVKRNGGVFPTQRVWDMIDGRNTPAGVGPHGAREMPVWGNVYRSEDTQPYELHVRTRISALIDYLSRIQEK